MYVTENKPGSLPRQVRTAVMQRPSPMMPQVQPQAAMVRSQQALAVFTKREWEDLARGLSLSPQQKAIGELLMNGMSDRQIALRLNIRVPTVRTHISRLFVKYHVADRVEFVVLCFLKFRRSRGELKETA